MPQTATLQITLSAEQVAFIEQKMTTGDYASQSEVVANGIDILRDQADAQARWEQEVLIPRLRDFEKSPTKLLSIEEVDHHLGARRQQRLQAK